MPIGSAVISKIQGSQTAQNIFIVATFYNASGTTVSGGWSEKLPSLSPSGTASFKVGAFDINMSQITPEQKITGYSLVVRPGDPIFNGTAPDASAYSIFVVSSTSQSAPSTSPTPTGSSTSGDATNSSSQWLIYAAIIIIVVIAVVITIKTLPKRKSAENKKTKPKATTGASPKAPSKKPQRPS